MTKLLENAFEQLSILPETEQDRLAAFILAEVEADKRWDSAFAESQDLLATLAKQALAEEAAGKTNELHLERDFPAH